MGPIFSNLPTYYPISSYIYILYNYIIYCQCMYIIMLYIYIHIYIYIYNIYIYNIYIYINIYIYTYIGDDNPWTGNPILDRATRPARPRPTPIRPIHRCPAVRRRRAHRAMAMKFERFHPGEKCSFYDVWCELMRCVHGFFWCNQEKSMA